MLYRIAGDDAFWSGTQTQQRIILVRPFARLLGPYLLLHIYVCISIFDSVPVRMCFSSMDLCNFNIYWLNMWCLARLCLLDCIRNEIGCHIPTNLLLLIVQSRVSIGLGILFDILHVSKYCIVIWSKSSTCYVLIPLCKHALTTFSQTFGWFGHLGACH